MNNIKVSVIIPIYNVEEYLAECLESVANQTLKEIEVLMIDDGSTDSSGLIAQEFEKKYSNFYYYYKKNGGLGNARNYAIPFVKGDYIVFLDSDDVVPSYAYEKMYDLAIRTGNDMIIGNVKRFNSSKEWNSGLHRKLFDASYEHTSIYEKPELVYDTTSWNKLFKTEFYLKNNFKFPEQILYEDIPVTIPAHFKANSVGMIDDICYLWRVRDGVTKSITQNRTEIRNLKDRLKIMEMVNKFYEENITDEKALYMKDFKWLDLDLKIYINKFLEVDDEYLDYAMETIRKFLKTIDLNILNEIRTIDRIKYHYILKNNKEKLLETLKYNNTAFKSATIKRKDGHYVANFPFKDIKPEILYMEKELSNFNPVQAVEKIFWDDNNLIVQGYFYLAKVKNQDDFKINAYLHNIYNDHNIPIKIARKEYKELTNKYGIKYCANPIRIAKYNYDNCGYQIKIPLSAIKEANGLYKIIINYSDGIIDNSFLIANNLNGRIKDNSLKCIEDKKIYTKFVSNVDLEIFFEKITKTTFEVVNHKDVNFKLLSNNQIYINTGKEINKLVNNVLELDKIVLGISKFFIYEQNEKKYLYLSNENECVFDKKNIYLFSNDLKGCMSVYKGEDVAFIESIKNNNSILKLKFILNKSFYSQSNNNPKIIFKNISYNYLVDYALEVVENNNVYEYTLLIDFKNEKNVKNLAGGLYQIYLEFDPMHQYKLVGYFNQQIYFSQDKYKYHFYVDENSFFCLNIIYTWDKNVNTKQKRRLLRKYIYPLLRKQPLKKNVIVFESFWGSQYSCNPRYLYEYLTREHPEFKCVWFLNDERIAINGNGIRIRRGTYEYYYYLARAKYFVNNVNFGITYKKRKGQIEIQTMHGTPLKTLGLDVKEDFTTEQSKIDFLEKCHRWNYISVQSDWTAKYTKHCYDFKKDYLRTGYPRNDVLFEKNNLKNINELKKSMGLPLNKKVILYAPTWRRKNYFDMRLDVDDMKRKLGDDYVLVLRLHHFSVAGLKDYMLNDFVYNFSSYPTIQDLYLISDILITDYSSVMFDYAILRRPMLFFTYDLDEYRDNLRGLNVDFESINPGPLLKTYEEVLENIIHIDNYFVRYNSQYQKFVDMFISYEKGNASKQIYDIVFKEK